MSDTFVLLSTPPGFSNLRYGRGCHRLINGAEHQSTSTWESGRSCLGIFIVLSRLRRAIGCTISLWTTSGGLPPEPSRLLGARYRRGSAQKHGVTALPACPVPTRVVALRLVKKVARAARSAVWGYPANALRPPTLGPLRPGSLLARYRPFPLERRVRSLLCR